MRHALLALVLIACGDATPHDAIDIVDIVDATDDVSADTSPSDVADTTTRPSNTTCLAWDRPPPAWSARFVPWRASIADVPTPVALAYLPATADRPARHVLADRAGVLVTFDAVDATPHRAIVLGDDARVVHALAVHPDFAATAELFVLVSDGDPGTQSLLRLDASGDDFSLRGSDALPASVSAAWMGVSPIDHRLYLGVAAAPDANASLLANVFGKLWRIDVDGPGLFPSAPSDNPFVDSDAPMTFALGFRDPRSGGFDRLTGDLWVVDHGVAVDELDRVQSGSGYGFPCYEGPPTGATTACGDSDETVAPIVRIPLGVGALDVAVVGGFVYRGDDRPGLAGTYLYAKSAGGLFGLAAGAPPELVIDADAPSLRALAEDGDGEVIGLGHDGRLWKLGPPPASAHPVPTTLSATGCVDPADAHAPAPGVVAYSVNVPLWSDGAEKHRYFAIPDDAHIEATAGGEWRFPPGSVLMKTFALGERPVETRLFVRHADGDWAGYSYAWTATDAADASLVDAAGTTATYGELTWTYPSRAQCLACHTAPTADYDRERPLGLETAQLDDGQGQLASLISGGWLVVPEDAPPVTPLPRSDDESISIEGRARAYLDANCAGCHQPGGPARGPDFRVERPFAEAGLCGVIPQANFGADVRIIDPGRVATSLVSLRMHIVPPTFGRMPPLATVIVDPLGTALVDAWITSLTGCPGDSDPP